MPQIEILKNYSNAPPNSPSGLDEVKYVTLPPSSDIRDQLEAQEFKVLPTGIDGTQVALHFSNDYGVVCCDIIAFRELNTGDRSLRKEATQLIQSLGQLQPQLCSYSHHFSPTIQSHAISFLGKKTHLFTTDTQQLLHCRLHPLLLIPNSQIAPSPKTLASIYPIHVLQTTELASYLRNLLTTPNTAPSSTKASFHLLHKAYQYLGTTIILLPLLLGLSGILWGLSLPLLALPLMLGGLFGPVFLLRRARSAFHQFRLKHTISIASPTALQTTPSRPPTPDTPAQEDHPISLEPPTEASPQPPTWTTTTTAAFLKDKMTLSITAALNAYQTENWKAFSEHTRAFLITGLRWGILKQTGQTPPDDIVQILDQIPSNETQDHLRAWVHRLAAARQHQPLSPQEAQQLMNFTVHLLRQQHAILAPMEAHIFQVVARLKEVPPPAVNLPTNICSTSPTVLPFTTKSPSVEQKKTTNLVTTTNKPTSGIPLYIRSAEDLDVLFQLIRGGASPYLMVFTKQFTTSAESIKSLLTQAANELGAQLNVVHFPQISEAHNNPDVYNYYALFRLEGGSTPPELPFLCVLTRRLLLHVTEDDFPVPPELIVGPHPDDFLNRVQSAIRAAQGYQIEGEPQDVESQGAVGSAHAELTALEVSPDSEGANIRQLRALQTLPSVHESTPDPVATIPPTRSSPSRRDKNKLRSIQLR